MNRLWAIFFFSMPVIGILVYVASASGWGPFAGTWLPQSMSTHADNVDHLFVNIHLVCGVVLALTGTILFVAIFRSNNKRPAKFTKGNALLEATWTIIPAVILVVLALYQSGTWNENKIQRPGNQQPLARVVARQFDWEFFYPGPDGKLDTADDIRSVNELVVPLQPHVTLELHSEDVIHSFSVPKLRLKQDIVPGSRHVVWFSPTTTGEMELICAELCGWGHYNMRAKMAIVEPHEFEDWLNQKMEQLSSGYQPKVAEEEVDE